MIRTRKEFEDLEKKLLASYAVKSSESQGRKFKEKEDKFRLCFQKDKERVIHSKSFRRLDEKTQVFMAGISDHFRTRLTHTLEVAQVARDIARRLALNEDLCEVIALAHDLGHPPFGHGGEQALDEAMQGFGLRFEHNQQSRRIVETLEKSYPTFDGLNLSVEVLDGMIKHQSPWDQANTTFEVSAHMEAQVVNIADEIAYNNHDVDDGLRSGLIKAKDLGQFELWRQASEIVEQKYGKIKDENQRASRTISAMMAMMIEDLCQNTEKNIKAKKIKTVRDVQKEKEPVAAFSEEMARMVKLLRQFLYDKLYMTPSVLALVEKGKIMIKKLFEYYVQNPDKFPQKTDKENFVIAVKDYIAGMTDRFLINQYNSVYNDSNIKTLLKIFYGVS